MTVTRENTRLKHKRDIKKSLTDNGYLDRKHIDMARLRKCLQASGHSALKFEECKCSQ